jgi:hypothetical protein
MRNHLECDSFGHGNQMRRQRNGWWISRASQWKVLSSFSTVLLYVSTAATLAQTPSEVGLVVSPPRSLPLSDPRHLAVDCKVICSPVEPRQSITLMSWPEGAMPGVEAPARGLEALRLDITSASAGFNAGDFGTVRLSIVPVAEVPAATGMNLEAVRQRIRPVLLQRVIDNRIVARDPALPLPEMLKTERRPGVREQMSRAAREALQRDDQAGSVGRMEILAQGVERRQSIPYRTVVAEGMQPGLTYRVRLVEERGSTADKLAENICRVPVCPADFIEGQ